MHSVYTELSKKEEVGQYGKRRSTVIGNADRETTASSIVRTWPSQALTEDIIALRHSCVRDDA